MFVARFGGGFVRRIILPDIAWGSSLIDMRMLVFTAGAAVLVGLLTGLVPALQASDPDLVAALKSGAREGGGRRSMTRSGAWRSSTRSALPIASA